MNADIDQSRSSHLLEMTSLHDSGVRSDNARLFGIYNGYRMIVSLCLLALLLVPAAKGLVSGFDRELFIAGCLLLLLSSVVLTAAPGRRVRQSETGTFGLMLADVTAIALLASASGGILSGLSVLYLVTVAAGAIMLRTRILATLIAAVAVLALLADTFWLVSRGETGLNMLVPAAVLGSLLFVVSVLAQVMASRLDRAEAQANAAESQVIALQQLNQQIIVHMHTGICLVDEQLYLRPINAAALRLLNLRSRGPVAIDQVSEDLRDQFEQWRDLGRHRPEPFRIQTDGPALTASFAGLDNRADSNALMFVEDYTPVTRFAQSLKLNSLGKLTASIAHEIRNPLASIRHAAQLLSESGTIDAADTILCDILMKNSDRVNDIIDNVTEVSRRQAPKPQTLPLNDWLPDCLEEYRSQAHEDAVIELSTSPEQPVITVDPRHLQRILSNLLDNALRHSLEDASRNEARVEVISDEEAGQVHIDVVDYGLGVADADRTHLFEPFFTRSGNGSGLGLYLCKDLCEINGAELTYRRNVAGESTFRVSINLEQEAS